MDEVFKALADPLRRTLLDRLNERGGQSLRELCDGLEMSRQAVTKHLVVLERANLLTSVRRGRNKLHYLNPVPINEIADRWIRHYDRQRLDALSQLKRALEEAQPMQKSEFVYTSYIRTTPEQLWRALTEPAFTKRYWGVAMESDWKKGSTYSVRLGEDVLITDEHQVILESEPGRRLSYTWHTFSPEWAAHYGFSLEVQQGFAAEPRSRVTFEIAPVGESVRLVVTHDGFEADSKVLEGITMGWPSILSSLKTLLETGSALPAVPS